MMAPLPPEPVISMSHRIAQPHVSTSAQSDRGSLLPTSGGYWWGRRTPSVSSSHRKVKWMSHQCHVPLSESKAGNNNHLVHNIVHLCGVIRYCAHVHMKTSAQMGQLATEPSGGTDGVPRVMGGTPWHRSKGPRLNEMPVG